MNHVFRIFRILFAAASRRVRDAEHGSPAEEFLRLFPSVGSSTPGPDGYVTLTFVLQNTSTGQGTSTINSFSIEVMSGATIAVPQGITMTAPTVIASPLLYSNGNKKVVVTDFPGIQKQTNATFQIKLSAANCPTIFNVAANAGNSTLLNGDPFIDTNGTDPDGTLYDYKVSCGQADLSCNSVDPTMTI